jgi:hypothetical protein
VDRNDIRLSLSRSVVSDHDLLRYTPVAYVTRDDENEVITKAIGLHATPSNAWGVVWKYCGRPSCSKPKDILSTTTKSGKVKQRCLRCNWKSKSLSTEDVGWVTQWSSGHPLVYTWSHPLEPAQMLSFAETTKEEKVEECEIEVD